LLIIHKPEKLASLLGYSLVEIENVVNEIKNHPRKYYYSYVDKKVKNGKIKLRPIDPSRHDLRNIQNLIQSKILSTIPMPSHLKGSIKGRNNIDNVKVHRGNKYHFQTDLTNFFGFVTNKMVFQMLRSFGFSPDVAHLLTALTTYKGHLPQGTPTSPTLANLVGLVTFDNTILEICQRLNIKYSRYVDDLWFSANTDFKNVEQQFLEAILNAGFLYSHKKTIGKPGKIEGTGCLRKTNGRLGLTKKQLAKLADPSLKSQSRKGIEAYKKSVESA
jgi:RNA-directed DNA polymerase